MPARLLAALVLVLLVAAPAAAAPSSKKAIWGPVDAFDHYERLGVGIWQTSLSWASVAPTRPADPRDPDDPAYAWPADLDRAMANARAAGIGVLLLVQQSPGWANGGRDRRWAPRRTRDFADFLEAAARRYPYVRRWMIWGEPSKAANFQPMPRNRSGPLRSARDRRGPRRYAELLDAAYVRLKRVSRRNLVIGGNTYTVGDVRPLYFLRAMKLRNGRAPRMDLYGHNAFSVRRPDLRAEPLGEGYFDFNDLDQLAGQLDRHLRRRGVKIFISEFSLPTDRRNYEFNFYVSRKTQADWLRRALRITRRYRRIATFGYLGLEDERPNAAGDEVRRGLIDAQGRRKPAFRVFASG